MGFKYTLKKNSISFIKRYDIWGTYLSRLFRKKRSTYLQFFYLIFLDKLFLKLKKKRKILRPLIFGRNRKNKKLTFLKFFYFKRFFYFKKILFKNQRKISSFKFKFFFI